MGFLDLFSLVFCFLYSVIKYKTSSPQELVLANLSFLLTSGFFRLIYKGSNNNT